MKSPSSNLESAGIFRRILRANLLRGLRGGATFNLQPSTFNHRGAPRRGVALIITLIMLSVITFMAVTFLVLSHRQQGQVSTTTDQLTAQYASESAAQRAMADLLARILAATNNQNIDLVVSTNFVNRAGFDLAAADFRTNVNYDHTITGISMTNRSQALAALRNLTNLFLNPRPPVYVVTNPAFPTNMEFRYYVDLNRNGRYDTNGFLPEISTNPFAPFINATNGALIGRSKLGEPIESNYFVGDPEWVGVLEHPNQPHGPNNQFLSRWAYIVIPASKTLDINYVHNDSALGDVNSGDQAFRRNMGVGTWEINLAAFLADLNTNYWDPMPFPLSTTYYEYLPLSSKQVAGNGIAHGTTFDQAAKILHYRYNYSGAGPFWANLQTPEQLFSGPALTVFRNDLIDEFGAGPIMAGTALPAFDLDNNAARYQAGWPGAGNTNLHFFSTQDFFDAPAKVTSGTGNDSFTNILMTAGTNNDSYNRYTYYRMLAQLGTDSTPQQNKIDVNYMNVDNAGNVVPGMETNMTPWRPLDFFTVAADRLLRSYSSAWTNEDYNAFTKDFGVTGAFGITNIPVYVNGVFVYTPAVHRVLQMAANIYDATTNGIFISNGTNTLYAPSVFRPIFRMDPQNNIFIDGFVEVTNDLAFLTQRIWDLTDTNDQVNLPGNFRPLEDSIYNVPLVIGAKKGLPNFNELGSETIMTVVRKLQFHKPDLTHVDQTNQTYMMSISNTFGAELWNSYTNAFVRPVELRMGVVVSVELTNDSGFVLASNTVASGSTNTMAFWPGFNSQSPSYGTNLFLPVVTNAEIRRMWTNNQFYSQTDHFPTEQWRLNTRARVRYALILSSSGGNDNAGGRLIDYVALSAANGPGDVTGELTFPDGANTVYGPGGGTIPQGALWSNLRVGGPETNRPSVGIMNQIQVSLGPPVGPDAASAGWVTPRPQDPSYPGDPVAAQEKFYFNMLGFNKPGDSTRYTFTNSFSSPFNPNRTVMQTISLQANDPLVHYTLDDLKILDRGFNQTNFNFWADADPNAPFATNQASGLSSGGLGYVNYRYNPWGGYVNNGARLFATSTAVKDPLVDSSDGWDFPQGKLPNVGWLGRVHRGTPWQTVYLKSSDVSTNANDFKSWKTWSGTLDDFTGTNTRPVLDRLLFDTFTASINDNAARGGLSVNQTNLAAWSAVLSGVIALTNQPSGTNVGPFVIAPAGPYNAYVPLDQQPPLVQIWRGISNTRTNFPNHLFAHLGDVLATPQLTQLSPFIVYTNNPPSDEVLERIPQQILGLLNCDPAPRFVIYAYGQCLKPADRSIYTSGGPLVGLCTNYQVTAETAVRAVVHVEGTPDPRYPVGSPDAFGRTYPPHIVVDQFNPMPAD